MTTTNIFPRAMIAQISDTHIVAPGQLLDGVDTAVLLEKSIAALLSLPVRPDAVLATGDLVDAGAPEQYQHLLHLLQPLYDAGIPVLPLVGNHDSREHLYQAIAGRLPDAVAAQLRPDGFIQYTTLVPDGLRVLALDTLVTRRPYGELCPQRLAWLDETLSSAPETPTLIAMHHPPFTSFIPFMDGVGLRNGKDELAAILRRHPQVERIISGHIHRSISARFPNEHYGIPASTCPSTAHQIQLTILPNEPGAFIMEPPGFQLHLWHPLSGIISHTIPVGDFGDPHLY